MVSDDSKRHFFSFPTPKELQACWELCRLQNNIGFWVMWLPTAWSIAMAYHAQKQITSLQAFRCAVAYIPLCFGIKSLIMTIDDILDSDIDGQVERTRMRPLPRGAISVSRAWLFFSCQAVIGIGLAVSCLSSTALCISAVVWPIYIIYPTCKRWTNLAPIPLGVMFNIGIFMGWADLSPQTDLPWNILLPIYIGTCLWTFTYETVYQHQDKADDIKIGLHSPALLLGDHTIPVCAITAIGFFSFLLYGGALNGHGFFYYGGVALAAFRLLSHIFRVNLQKPEDCKRFFMDTVWVGQIIFGGMLLDVSFHRLTNRIPL